MFYELSLRSSILIFTCMKDFKNGVATPKLELSSMSIFSESSGFVYTFQELLEEISSDDIEIDVFVFPLDDNAGALHEQSQKDCQTQYHGKKQKCLGVDRGKINQKIREKRLIDSEEQT